MKAFIIVTLLMSTFVCRAESSSSDLLTLKPKLVRSSSLTEQEYQDLVEYIDRWLGIDISEEGCRYKILKFSPSDIESLENLENIEKTKIKLPGLYTLKHNKRKYANRVSTDLWYGEDGRTLLSIAYLNKGDERLALNFSTPIFIEGHMVPTYIQMFNSRSLLAIMFFDSQELACFKKDK